MLLNQKNPHNSTCVSVLPLKTRYAQCLRVGSRLDTLCWHSVTHTSNEDKKLWGQQNHKYVSSSKWKNCYMLCVFIFNFIKRKTAMHNIFINKTGHKRTQEWLGRVHILFDISFANKSQSDSNSWYNKWTLLMCSACSC